MTTVRLFSLLTVKMAIRSSAIQTYISTAPFHTHLFSYSTFLNATKQTVGELTQVAGANLSNCPAGRVLRENGRKLFPGANPGITTYMVGVYDAQSLLSGFIDPNAKVFQIYNTDKPTSVTDGVDPTTGKTDLGPSVYTRGDVSASRLIAQNPITLTQVGGTTLIADCSLTSFFLVDVSSNTNFTIDVSNVTTGQYVTFLLNLKNMMFTPQITMGANVRESALGSIVIASGRQATISFIGYEGYLVEVGRVATLNTS
jgi:hypothetical protein